MKILIALGNYYGPPWKEGVANLARRFAQFLNENGEEVHVVSTVTPDDSQIKGKKLKKNLWIFRFKFLKRILNNVKLLNPDVVFLFSSCSSGLGIKTFIFYVLTKKPIILYITGLYRPVIGYKRMLKAKKIIVGSPFLKRYFPNATIIPPFLPVDLRQLPTSKSKNPGVLPFKLLYLGAFEKGRGVEILLDAVKIVKENTHVSLILALNGYGDKDPIKLKKMIKDMGLEETVDLRGLVDLNQVYHETDAVVIPREHPYRMSFPVRIVESITMQKPLIVTRACDMHEVIDGCGLAAEPGDPVSLARAIIDMAEKPALYEQCLNNCKKMAMQYDSEISLKRLYKEVAELVN